jgi:hypothetical protein
MWFQLVSLLMPFAVNMVKEYVKSTDSTKDDLVLSLTQDTAQYLCNKDNNSVTEYVAKSLASSQMTE